MTKAELLEQLSDVPDDYIICTTGQFDGKYYELNSIETFEDEDYFDINDEPVKGNIVTL